VAARSRPALALAADGGRVPAATGGGVRVGAGKGSDKYVRLTGRLGWGAEV